MFISHDVSGRGDPIIFIHGVGSRKSSWNPIKEKLNDQYRCVSYDLRGHGESPLPKDNIFFLNDLVDDLEQLRLQLDLNKIHLVGHSLGGQIGPAYAKKYPENVLTLTMLSTAAFRTDSEKQKIYDLIHIMKTKGLDEVLPTLISRWYTDNFAKENPQFVANRIKMIQEMELETFCQVFWIYADCMMENWIHEIKIPTLVMTGENDLSCNPRINKMIVEAMPNARLEILQDLRHSITGEKPDLVAIKIRNFYEEVENAK